MFNKEISNGVTLGSECTAKILFSLHPEKTLQVALLKDVVNPVGVAEASAKFSHREGLVGDTGRFAIIAANRIMSLDHISVAANSALFREIGRKARYRSQTSDTGTSNDGKGQASGQKEWRGIALDTVFAAAGSLNETTVLKEYGFKGKDLDTTNSNSVVVALCYDSSQAEMEEYLEIVGGTLTPFSYFKRKRTDIEIKDLIKAFKLSPQEVDANNHKLMELAVINRVATKFVT